jgi:hypothetical protein
MIRFSTFANIRDNRPKMNALPSWEAFADYLEDQSNIEGTAKDKTLCICPATYPDGVVRAKSAVEGWQWFAADIDNKPVNEAHSTIEAVAEIMFAQNCPFVIYTTSSHTMEAHRFRLMFPMDRLVKPDEFADVWKSMAQWLGCLDAPTKDESRLFVAPRAWPGSFFFRHDGGEPVCVDMITLTNPVITRPLRDPYDPWKVEFGGWQDVPVHDRCRHSGTAQRLRDYRRRSCVYRVRVCIKHRSQRGRKPRHR